MKFLATSGTRHLVIDAERWFDAKQYASRVLEDPDVQQTGEHAVPDVCLRWVGSDYRRNGGRVLEIRKRGGQWKSL